ncbi:uncharacterized protein HD556DRAFT_1314742 [Suillus plorans]|uniref:DUF6533 domain-containing protein n=1 Tax=Suillus plorans TaxID=116603 RepID=A0A9P7DAB5_9AGAM|nr:uncharacterized protein HD556DRAFT_1314742 [Suillus plorans]KAG1784832.1 hypothetical protein HD556DRAFT_1314742 [Suillus plorans]
MTVVLNDPRWWPILNSNVFFSYWIVAAGAVVVYDWVLTLGQEIELIWKQRRSLMTVLYLVIRYIGLPYSVPSLVISISVLVSMPSVSLTDAGCNIMYYATNGTTVVITAMLGVIAAIGLKDTVLEELVLSGVYVCGLASADDAQILGSTVWILNAVVEEDHLLALMLWMLNTVWEVIALCLSLWIAVKHFHDLRRLGPLTGSIVGDCFRVLIRSHVLYFASFVCVSCLELASLSPELMNSISIGTQILVGTLPILLDVQMFVLGPRLILSVREYHAKLVADSDAETSMRSIIFQERERVHVPTSSAV